MSHRKWNNGLNTGQCCLFCPLFHFLCDILCPHPEKCRMDAWMCVPWGAGAGGLAVDELVCTA